MLNLWSFLIVYLFIGTTISVYLHLSGHSKYNTTTEKLKVFFWSITLWPLMLLLVFSEGIKRFRLGRLKRIRKPIVAEVTTLDDARIDIIDRLEVATSGLESLHTPEALSTMLGIFGELRANEGHATRTRLETLEKEIRSLSSEISFIDREPTENVTLEFSRVLYTSSKTPQIRFSRPLFEFLEIGPPTALSYDTAETEPHILLDIAGPKKLYKFDADRGGKRESPTRREEWSTYFSSSFKRDVAALDRRLQGRLMNAVLDIAEQPTAIHGDTQKPLTGNLTGKWRYRLGDYRVIYVPDSASFAIVFLRCAARGEVYH